MVRTGIIFLVCFLYTRMNCASAYTVHKGGKCGVHDDNCLQNFFHGVFLEAATSGIKSKGIPCIDPYLYKNANVDIMDLINFKSSEAIVKGFKTCQLTKYHLDMKKMVTKITYTCELLTAEGDYHIQSTPALAALIKNIEIKGNGHGTFTIDNSQINLELPFLIKVLGDGELHFVLESHKITFDFEILGKAYMTADNLFVGGEDITTQAVNIFNENWPFFVNTYGHKFVKMGVDVFADYTEKYLVATPVKDIMIEDLSAHVTQ